MRAGCSWIAAIVLVACGKQDSPPSTEITSAQTTQDLAPVRAFDRYLDGFHVTKGDAQLDMEAHHYCKAVSEELTECAIFDGSDAHANLIGIEYIISESLFRSLDAEEKKSWHPHDREIISGPLALPGAPAAAERATPLNKTNSYGKTWLVWDTGHHGHIGRKLAWMRQ